MIFIVIWRRATQLVLEPSLARFLWLLMKAVVILKPREATYLANLKMQKYGINLNIEIKSIWRGSWLGKH